MKNKILVAAVAALAGLGLPLLTSSRPVAAAAQPATAATSYDIDGGHSGAMFRIKHLDVSYFHGRFNSISGSFDFDPADMSKSRIELSIDAASVDSNSKDRDGHIMSPDFFDVKQFPKIEFKSTGAKATGDKTFDLMGELTFHGVTKPVTAAIEYVGSGSTPMGNRAGFEGTFTINRGEFGMDWKMGEGVLGEDVRISVFIEGRAK